MKRGPGKDKGTKPAKEKGSVQRRAADFQGQGIVPIIDESDVSSMGILRKVFDDLGKVEWTKAVEAYAASHIIPLLQSRSGYFSAIFRDGEVSSLIHQLSLERDSLLREKVKSSEREKELKLQAEKMEKLLEKKDWQTCSSDCKQVLELQREELLKAIRENVKYAILHLDLSLRINDKALHALTGKSIGRVYSTVLWGSTRYLLEKSDEALLQSLIEAIDNYKKNGGNYDGIISAVAKVRDAGKLFGTK